MNTYEDGYEIGYAEGISEAEHEIAKLTKEIELLEGAMKNLALRSFYALEMLNRFHRLQEENA